MISVSPLLIRYESTWPALMSGMNACILVVDREAEDGASELKFWHVV